MGAATDTADEKEEEEEGTDTTTTDAAETVDTTAEMVDKDSTGAVLEVVSTATE